MGRLIRWEPMTGISHLRDDMNRLLEDFFGETAEERAPAEMMRMPKVDIIDHPDAVVVRAELPGIDKDKVQLEASTDALLIRAEMLKEQEEKGENYLRRERRMGSFQRVVPLPVEVKPDAVKARYRDGILEVTLPKSETARSRQPVKIDIE